jgi:fatty acid/phospholipid biosynthesis enzyme
MTDQPETPTDETTDEQTAFEIFLDHQRKAATQAGRALEGLIPTAMREHGSAAFKEMVEGYRQLFNATIDQVVDRIEKSKMERKSSDETAE